MQFGTDLKKIVARYVRGKSRRYLFVLAALFLVVAVLCSLAWEFLLEDYIAVTYFGFEEGFESTWAKAEDVLEGLLFAALALLLPLFFLYRSRLANLKIGEALKQHEARLAQAGRIAKLGYMGWDKTGDRQTYGSEEASQLFGLPGGTQFASHDEFLQSVSADDRARVEEVAVRARDTATGYEMEYEIVRPDGTRRTVLEMADAEFDADGALAGTAVTLQDVTERRQLERQLIHFQKMEAVGQLTGGVAHDFNNLLAVIMGNAEVLRTQIGDDNKPILAVIRAATRGAELVQRLLAFSRRQPLRPQVLDLDTLVHGMSDMLHRTLGENIKVQTPTTPDLWRALTDPAQLENALLNLAINARDAMPGGGTLVIETANCSLDNSYAINNPNLIPGDYVMLAVSDSGTGMSPRVREHAFEPFFTTKEVGKGTGLGLSMVYGFAGQSGGHVSIYSEEGKGTTVKLYLPRSNVEALPASTPKATENPMAAGETVLVVDDDSEVRRLAVALLEDLGYKVQQAPNGKAALSILEAATQIDLLLADMMLPGGMTGPDLALQAKQREPDLAVLFMSGFAEQALHQTELIDGSAELLNKPFRKSDLAQKVRAVLNR